MTLKLIFTPLILLYLNISLSAQEMPLKLGKLPDNIEYEFKGSTTKVFENKKTDFYSFTIGEKNGGFIKITTSGLADVIMILSKSNEGGDLYRKLDDGTYKRIVECRKNGHEFDIYLVDENNISTKFTTAKKEASMDALMTGYSLYWSNNKPN